MFAPWSSLCNECGAPEKKKKKREQDDPCWTTVKRTDEDSVSKINGCNT